MFTFWQRSFSNLGQFSTGDSLQFSHANIWKAASSRCGIFEVFALAVTVMMAVCHVRILSRAFRVGRFILGSCALPPQYN